MEPKHYLPCSHKPSNGPYRNPKPDHTSQPKSLRNFLISLSHLRLFLASAFFPSSFPTKILYASQHPCMLHVSPNRQPLMIRTTFREEFKSWNSLLSYYFCRPAQDYKSYPRILTSATLAKLFPRMLEGRVRSPAHYDVCGIVELVVAGP